MSQTYFIFGEDMAPGMVGPFETRKDAEEHIEFQRRRGDAAVCIHNNTRIVTFDEIEKESKLKWAFDNNRCTPERDRAIGADKTPLVVPHVMFGAGEWSYGQKKEALLKALAKLTYEEMEESAHHFNVQEFGEDYKEQKLDPESLFSTTSLIENLEISETEDPENLYERLIVNLKKIDDDKRSKIDLKLNLEEVKEAFGVIDTKDGRSLSLEGRVFHVFRNKKAVAILPISDLWAELKGTKVIGIGEDEIGDEAHNLINGVVYDTVAKVNKFFGL